MTEMAAPIRSLVAEPDTTGQALPAGRTASPLSESTSSGPRSPRANTSSRFTRKTGRFSTPSKASSGLGCGRAIR